MTGVEYSVDGAVAFLTLNRPEARNALNMAMRDGLRSGFADFAADDSAAVLVVQATGPTFCAGADLAEMASLGSAMIPRDFVPAITDIDDCHKPVVAAVQGAALGGGFWLAQQCDLVVAADDARFGITEARWGRGAPWAAPLLSLIGARPAMELLITAEPLDAYRAHEIGLVNHVVPAGELARRAGEIAAHIASLAPLSVRAGVQMVRAHRAQSAGALADAAWQMWQPVYESADAQEGPRAFAEKRPPVWRGL